MRLPYKDTCVICKYSIYKDGYLFCNKYNTICPSILNRYSWRLEYTKCKSYERTLKL